mmetsp:Transcript_8320/g.27705  ORF Transcript_8320/g.27705 Transcript_8320/m.27705 type:complete len:215 (+) Transcript_8320:878-1522(+)
MCSSIAVALVPPYWPSMTRGETSKNAHPAHFAAEAVKKLFPAPRTPYSKTLFACLGRRAFVSLEAPSGSTTCVVMICRAWWLVGVGNTTDRSGVCVCSSVAPVVVSALEETVSNLRSVVDAALSAKPTKVSASGNALRFGWCGALGFGEGTFVGFVALGVSLGSDLRVSYAEASPATGTVPAASAEAAPAALSEPAPSVGVSKAETVAASSCSA